MMRILSQTTYYIPYPCILSNHGEEITMSLIGAVMWMQTFIYNIVNCVNHFHMLYLQCPYSSLRILEAGNSRKFLAGGTVRGVGGGHL